MNRLLILLATALLTAALAGCDSASGPPPAPGSATSVTVEAPAVSRPTRIRIPSLQVDANIIDLDLQANGEMQVPPDAKDAGWYTKSPVPGQTGPSVLAAHVNWKGVDGPFARLHEMKAGDRVEVVHEDGAVSAFIVYATDQYPKDHFPTDEVYGDSAEPLLKLITCTGTLVDHSYADNLVVSARLVT